MSCLPIIALLSVLSFPCMAETLEDQFSRMDVNKDGFLSRDEFVQGMKQAEPVATETVSATPLSEAERQKLVDQSVAETKGILPFKVDQATTWTDVYGQKDEIHYIYRIETDMSSLPEEQMEMLRPAMESQICSKIRSPMCGVAKDTLFINGISITTHYNDKTGKTMAKCRFTIKDCP